jgi:phosphodiesterase/alkaline phosphatase D-like protein
MKVILCFFLFFTVLLGADPQVVYLTWTEDPTSTMTIQWHAVTGSSQELDYRGIKDPHWKSTKSTFIFIEGTDVDVHTVHLKELAEDTVYLFKLGTKTEYKFRTMPKKLNRPVRFAIGGDVFYIKNHEAFHLKNQMIADQDPDFIIAGGDLAYTKGKKQFGKGRAWELHQWQGFLKGQETIKGKNGRLIPMLPIVGNHDVAKPEYQTAHPEMFFQIFAFPHVDKAYRCLDFGAYLSLILLDSDHNSPIEGKQTAWLQKTLEEKQSTYLLSAYHVAAYPSHNPYAGKIPEKLRHYWSPLFEQFKVPFVFEHHNHAFKRTHPI